MEFDWTTFVFEIINFLVLVWLLKRFFYRPILGFIAQRRAETEQAIASARHEWRAAETLKQQYERRLEAWAGEREAARAKLLHELQDERSRRLAEIKKTIEQEREKARIADKRAQREFRENAELAALELGARFAGRLLERASGSQSTDALVEMVTEEITSLTPEQRNALLQTEPEKVGNGTIETAHPLVQGVRGALESTLTQLFARPVQWQWRVVPELVAGVRIELGSWVLAANVRDELAGFTALGHG